MKNAIIEKTFPKYKYIILTLFSLVSFMDGMLWCTFMPITSFTAQILNIKTIQVYFLSGVFMIVNPIIYYFANYFLDQKGLRCGLHVGTAFACVGSLIRCLGYYGYIPLIIGQTLVAIGEPFILYSPSKLVNEWFEVKKRPFYITIAGNMNNIGNSIGFLISSAFIKPGSTDKMEFLYLLVAEAGIVLVISILQFSLFKVSPYINLDPNARLCNTMSYKMLLKNGNCILEILSASFSIANFCTFITVFEGFITPFGYSSSDASWLGFILIFAGVGESLLFGIFISKTQKYKAVYMSVISVSFLLICLLYTIANQHLLYLMIITVVLLGPGMVYIIPLSFDYVQLLSPEVGESISCGLLPTLGQIISFVQVLICDKTLYVYNDKKGCIYVIGILGIVNLIALFLGIYVVETYLHRNPNTIRDMKNLYGSELLSSLTKNEDAK